MRVKKIKSLAHVVAQGFIMDKRTLTEPDLSLSINEILKYHVRRKGESIKPEAYDLDGVGASYERLSSIDKEVRVQENRKHVENLKLTVNKDEASRKNAEIQKKINEQVASKLKEASERSGAQQ